MIYQSSPCSLLIALSLLCITQLTLSAHSSFPSIINNNAGNISKQLPSVEEIRQQVAPPLKDENKESAAEFLDNENFADTTFYHALLASFSVIIVSELGDKTWFIAAIMAMTHSRITVFCGAMAALILMTLLSAGMGWLTQVIPRFFTFYISTALFALFGVKMLYDGYRMSPSDEKEEYEEAKTEVQKKDLLLDSPKYSELESGGVTNSKQGAVYAVVSFVSTLFLEAFTLTFLAEWGDRSQLTTIMLAARENVYGVVLGSILGHALCTGIAVIGGKLVATQISVRTVTLIGGVVFIMFALSAFFITPE